MKIIKTIYPYRYDAKEIIALFKNLLMKVFWRNNTAKDTTEYYEINRAISNNIDDMFEVLICEFRMTYEIATHYKGEHIENIVKERIARQIADELIKGGKVVVNQSTHMAGDFVYRTSIAFLKREVIEQVDE